MASVSGTGLSYSKKIPSRKPVGTSVSRVAFRTLTIALSVVVGIFLVKHLPPAPTGGTFAPVPEHKKETAAKDPMQRPVDELGKQAWRWPSEPSQRPTVEVPARPVPEPETERPLLNVSQKEDAMRVQQRLIELNYLEGVADGIWGPRSRLALMTFRSLRGLGSDDTWDYATQEGLFDRSARKLAFVGAWTDEAGQC